MWVGGRGPSPETSTCLLLRCVLARGWDPALMQGIIALDLLSAGRPGDHLCAPPSRSIPQLCRWCLVDCGRGGLSSPSNQGWALPSDARRAAGGGQRAGQSAGPRRAELARARGGPPSPPSPGRWQGGARPAELGWRPEVRAAQRGTDRRGACAVAGRGEGLRRVGKGGCALPSQGGREGWREEGSTVAMATRGARPGRTLFILIPAEMRVPQIRLCLLRRLWLTDGPV